MGNIHYMYKDDLYSEDYYFNERKQSKFKSLYGFKEKIQRLKKEYTKDLDCVIAESIILDIDNKEDVDNALSDTHKIVEYLSEKYDAKVNVYYSGMKGFHIEIPLSEPLELYFDNNRVNAYVSLQNEIKREVNTESELDEDLQQTTRLISLHHKKKNNDKGRTYKISIGKCKDLKTIRKYGRKNKDIEDPDSYENLKFVEHLKNLNERDILSKLETGNNGKKPSSKTNKSTTNYDITALSDKLCSIHSQGSHDKIISPIGFSCMEYLNKEQANQILDQLKTNDRLNASTNNLEGTFWDAYNDGDFNGLGAVYNSLELSVNLKDETEKKCRFELFNEFKDYLESCKQLNSKDAFNTVFKTYDNDWFKMLDKELFDYVDNTENVFKGIINGLSALFGYSSRFIVVNGGAEVGKSEYVNTISKLMPKYKNLGSVTPAVVRRKDTYEFDKTIVYLGDKGLKGKDDEEFKGLQEVFGGLITEKEFIRPIIVGEKEMDFNLKSDGICVFYTEPYTNLRMFGAGDQYTTRSTFITVNPVEDGLSVFLQDEDSKNTFYDMHKNYIKYILYNPVELEITEGIKTKIYYASNESLRTAKYLKGLFKSYCQYLQIQNPSLPDVDDFLKTFQPKSDITDIEYAVYEKLYFNLKPLTKNEFEKKYESGWNTKDDMLNKLADRKSKSFFTVKQIKTYFKNDFKHNKNLKDVLDNVGEILNNLYDADRLDRIETGTYQENIYYIPYNDEMQALKEEKESKDD